MIKAKNTTIQYQHPGTEEWIELGAVDEKLTTSLNRYTPDYTEAVIAKGFSHDEYVITSENWLAANPYVIRYDGKALTAEEVIALLNQVENN